MIYREKAQFSIHLGRNSTQLSKKYKFTSDSNMLQVANIILHPLIYQLIYLCIHSYSVLKIICPLGIPRALLRIMHLKHLCVPYLENGNKNHIKIIALRCHLQGVVYFLERGCSNLEFFFAVTEQLKSGEDDCH